MRNITIAVDDRMLEQGREYARHHHVSLNKLIRDLLRRTVVSEQSQTWTREFFRLADKAKGNSGGKRWRREELYDAAR